MSSFKWLKSLKNLRIGAVTGTGQNSSPSTALNGAEIGIQNQVILSRNASTSAVPLKKRPKRPLAPYLRFAMLERPSLVKANPKVKVSEIASLLGQKWTNLSDEEKQKFSEEYLQEMPAYSKQIEKYNQSLTEADKDAIKNAKLQKELRREKREKRDRNKELGKPKKPQTPFLLYLVPRTQKGIDPRAYAEKCKEIANEWNNLPEDEKKPYMEKYQAEKLKYDTELHKWEQKMLRQGYTDVVRLQTLKEYNQKD